ncbi:MAG: DUF192 domain-containing protein [Candidatus Paceibacterota bacterium]
MKKIIQTIIVIILFVASGFIFWAGLSPQTFSKFWQDYSPLVRKSESIQGSVGEIIIKNSTWEVEVVTDNAQKETGLSNRKTLYSKKGMLFVFDKSAKQIFWMKDMLIPIDIIFLDENWKIVLIETNLQPQTFPKTFGSNVKSKYVLEINAGEAELYDLRVGDLAIFLNK